MPYSFAGRHVMLNSLAAAATHLSLHSAYPGDTGANELAGGAPAYTRQPVTWNAAASGVLDNVGTQTFDIPPLSTVAFVGVWSALAAGTFYGSAPVGSGIPVPFTAEDSTDILTADNHGFADGQQVVVWDTQGAVIPTGLTQGDVYFVVSATGDTLKLSLTSGGAVINLTSDGAGFIQRIQPEVFGGQGTFDVADIDLDLLN